MLKKTPNIFDHIPDIIKDLFYILPFLFTIVVAIAPTEEVKVIQGYYLYWGTLQTERGTDIYMMVEVENGKKVKVSASKKQLSHFKKGTNVSIVKEVSSLGFSTYSIKLIEQKITKNTKHKYASSSPADINTIKMSKTEKIIFFSIGLWFVIVFFWLNILASIVLIADNIMSFNEKRNQLITAWLVPYIAASFILHMNIDCGSKSIPKSWVPFGFKKLIYNNG
jgi:hypothetical protein